MKVEMIFTNDGEGYVPHIVDLELPSRFIIRGRKGDLQMYGGYRDTEDDALEKAFELVSHRRFYDGNPYTVEIQNAETKEILYRVIDVNRDEVLVKDFTDDEPREYEMLHYRDAPKSALINFKFTKDYESRVGFCFTRNGRRLVMAK